MPTNTKRAARRRAEKKRKSAPPSYPWQKIQTDHPYEKVYIQSFLLGLNTAPTIFHVIKGMENWLASVEHLENRGRVLLGSESDLKRLDS